VTGFMQKGGGRELATGERKGTGKTASREERRGPVRIGFRGSFRRPERSPGTRPALSEGKRKKGHAGADQNQSAEEGERGGGGGGPCDHPGRKKGRLRSSRSDKREKGKGGEKGGGGGSLIFPKIHCLSGGGGEPPYV